MNTNFPPTEKIMATPSIEPTAPLAPSPVDNEKIKLGIAPGNQWNEEGTYCNVLPPAPRNQLAANPIAVNQKDCYDYKSPKYNPKKCYFTYDKAQNMPGLFCGGPGGSGNSNFVRGNQFGNSYCGKNFQNNSRKNVLSIGDNQLEIKIDDNETNNLNEYSYDAQIPVQKTIDEVLFKDNQIVVDKSQYYPYPGFKNRFNKNYRTFPHGNNYTKSGQPIYTKSNNVIEGFDGGNCSKCNSTTLWTVIIIVMLAILILLFTKR